MAVSGLDVDQLDEMQRVRVCKSPGQRLFGYNGHRTLEITPLLSLYSSFPTSTMVSPPYFT